MGVKLCLTMLLLSVVKMHFSLSSSNIYNFTIRDIYSDKKYKTEKIVKIHTDSQTSVKK